MSSSNHIAAAERIRLLGMVMEEDPFSWKVTHPRDPMFWIRIEKEAPIDWVNVSDLTLSAQAPRTVAAALALVLEVTGIPERFSLRIAGISSERDGNSEAQTQYWREFCALFAVATQRFICSVHIEKRHGKRDAIATFE